MASRPPFGVIFGHFLETPQNGLKYPHMAFNSLVLGKTDQFGGKFDPIWVDFSGDGGSRAPSSLKLKLTNNSVVE